MRQYLCNRGVLVLALFGLLSTSVYGAKVGYYEMYDGQGNSWAIAPITAAGHTPVYLSDLTAADLQGLDVLFVSNSDNQGYGAEYLSRLPEVDLAVQNGLSLLIHDRKVSGASAILPGGAGIQSVRSGGREVDVVDNTTLVTNGPSGVITSTSLDGATYANHGYLQAASLPIGARTILSRADPSQSVVTSYAHGKGSVVYSSVPLDAYAGIMPICTRFSWDQQYQACVIIVGIYAPNAVDFAVKLTSNQSFAKAGLDQSVDEGLAVALDGSTSSGHGALSYQWQQLSPASPLLVLTGSNSAKPTFTAPAVNMNTTFTLQLVVTDLRGNISAPDTVDVTVKNLNTPPVADAGDDFAIKAGAVASLDGIHSYDADGDTPLLYSWSQIGGPAVTLQTPTDMKPSFVVPNAVGQDLVFELTVGDGQELSLASRVIVSIVDNAAPLADAGIDQTRDEGNIILLNALASVDPDKDGLLFDWAQIAGSTMVLDNPGSPTPYFTAPRVAVGGVSLVFAVTVTDTDALNPKSSVAQVAIHVRNINDPPACHLARPSVASLWPPNHKMRPVSIDGVSDKDSIYKDVAIVINNVTMDEPVVGRGSGHSSPDAVIQDMDPSDQVLLRAERKKHSNGRVYQVNFTASDGFESCTGNIQVSVPKSRKHKKCDDDDDDDHGKHKGHKSKREHSKRCQAPIVVDDGQLHDATEVRQHRHHDKEDEDHDKSDKLNAKLEKKAKNKKHQKKSRHDDD